MPVGPGAMLVVTSSGGTKSQCVRKKPGTALSNTTTFSSAALSSSVMTLFSCGMDSGP